MCETSATVSLSAEDEKDPGSPHGVRLDMKNVLPRMTILKELEEDELPGLGEAILFVIGKKYPGLSHATITFDHFWPKDEPGDLSADIELRTWPHGVRAQITAEWIYAKRADQADDDEGEYSVIRVDFKWSSLLCPPNPKYWWEHGPEIIRKYTFYVFGEILRDFEIGPIKEKPIKVKVVA